MVADSSLPADVEITRTAYDEVAELYTEYVKDDLTTNTFDRAMLGAFAELMQPRASATRQRAGHGRVADIGCGPGRITAHLATLGLDAFGIDLAPEMITIARRQYPELSFEVGSMERLAWDDESVGGIVAWFSIIHLPPERMPEVLNEFHRVLGNEGHALLAFQATEVPDDVEAFDHKVTRAYRWSPERLAAVSRDAGFSIRARLIRQADPHERFPSGYLLVSKLR